MPTRLFPMPMVTHPFYSPDDPSGGGTPADTTPPPATDEPLGESGKKALDAEREARKAAEKAAKDVQAELDRLRADAQQRADAEAAEQGKWKELAEKREADLSTTTTTLTAAQERLAALEQLAADRLTALLDGIPAEIVALLPGEDTPIEQRLAKAEQAAKAAAALKPQTPGNGPNPNPANGAFDLNRAKEAARSTGKYTI